MACLSSLVTFCFGTGRKFGTRIEEHKSEAEKVSNKIATRAGRKDSMTSTHKSAITDHVADKNHVIGGEEAKVLGTHGGRQIQKMD